MGKNSDSLSETDKSIGSRIINGTIIIVLIGILAKFASFILEAVLAAFLGTTYQSDAYYMVWSVHGVIYPMMSIGIWKVFLPLYKSHIAKKETETAFQLTDKALTFFTSISIGVAVLLVIFAPQVVSVVAPGFKNETRELCIKLVRISAPQYVFIIASAVYASILQCHEKFLGSQIREVVSHIPVIIAAVFFYRLFGIESLAIGLVVAGILRLLIELPFVDWGYRYKPDFGFTDEEFTLMLKRLPSALISAGVVQLNTLVDKSMASTLSEGTISVLNYGQKLMNVFSGLLSSAIATAMYPQMIELITLKKEEELGRLIVKIINIFLFLMVPITAACILFRKELVTLAFQRGAFNYDSTVVTSNIFALYCIGLFFIASNTVISNVFYGYGDTNTAMKISVANLVINVGLNLVLIRPLGANGLALATSVSAVTTFAIRLHAAGKYVRLDFGNMIATGCRTLIAAGISCIIPRIIFLKFDPGAFLVLIISAVIGVSMYLIISKALRIEEMNVLIHLIKGASR